MKKTVLILLAFISIFFGCSKSDEDEKGNYVKLDNVSYTISSAVYFVDNGNLTIQFETAEPDVFLYFKGRSSIPLGETNVSYESLDDNCIVTYCFETEDYLSIDGNVTISLDGGDYTVEAEGHTQSMTSGDRNFKIHYNGNITMVNQGGSGGGSGNGGSSGGGSSGGGHTNDRFSVSPVFSYYESAGGDSRINVYCDNANMTWKAVSNSEWCQIIDSPNGVGNGSIEITVHKNLTMVDRSAKIIFTSGDGKTSRSVSVIQHAGGYDMVVKPERLDFSASGNAINTKIIHVYIYKPDTRWTATCNASWVQLSATSGTSNTDISVIVEKNTTTEERVAVIQFKSSNGTIRYVTLYQRGGINGNFKVAITNAEYQVQQSNNMVVKVRYYIKNQSSSYTLYYLKFSAKHPSGYTDIQEMGSKTNPSAWTLAPGAGTYTPYYTPNPSFQYKEGNISGNILDFEIY